jgi:hypothetical protein
LPWTFTILGAAALTLVGVVDRRWLKLHPRLCFYPLPLFLIAQLFALWLIETNARFPEINW